jgi:hypothetical protein
MDLVLHAVVPLLFLLAAGTNKKHALALLPLSLLPDVGRFFYLMKGFHSLFFILLALGCIYLLNYAARKGREAKGIVGISAFYLFSHLLLDLGGYMALFFPLSGITYAVQARVELANFVPRVVLGISTGGLGELEQGIGTVVSEPGVGIMLLIAAAIAYLKIKMVKMEKGGALGAQSAD